MALNKEKAPKGDTRQQKDKDDFQKVVRKQYMVKQKQPTQQKINTPNSKQHTGDTPVCGTKTQTRSPRKDLHLDEVTSPNPFAALATQTDNETIGEDTNTTEIPIKALGAYPIDNNE